MVTIDASARATDGVTLVTVSLAGDGIPRRVRVEQRLDGPVWPPRRAGQPEPGWDETGYEGVVPADERLTLGYATPALPAPEPVSVEELSVARDDSAPTADEDPRRLLQRLGNPSPPRGAVPLPPAQTESAPVDAVADETPLHQSQPADRVATDSADPSGAHQQAVATEGLLPGDDGGVSDPVTAWLSRIEHRLETLERLDEIDSVPEATTAVGSIGGLTGCERAITASRADRRRLLVLADRVERLAARIDAAEPPLSTLERLA